MTALRTTELHSDQELRDEYADLERQERRIQARKAAVLARIDRRQAYQPDYLTPTAFVRHTTGVSGAEARRRVHEARGLARHHLVRSAFETGAIDRSRVALLLKAAKVSDDLFARDEALLVDQVTRFPARHASRLVRYWMNAADQTAALTDDDHLRNRRNLHISTTWAGMVRIDGDLDPESGAIVKQAIDSLVDPTYLDSNDDRTNPQRRADALVDLAEQHLRHGATPTSGGTKPHITLTVSQNALRGEPDSPCEVDGVVVTTETARRIACDASVTTVVVNDEGLPIGVGRAHRTIPPWLRRALDLRDGGCVEPGCDIPPRFTDAHHKTHWADGGETNLDDLELRCRRHHTEQHSEERRPTRV